nr:hypothetical protein [Tanacetum cinerariifolium]
MKRVSKTIGLLDEVAKIHDPQCELLLIQACAGISKLYFAMRTWPLVPLSRLNFLLTWLFVPPWSSAALQTKLLRYVGISASGATFDDALCVFNSVMEIDFLSNLSEMALWQSQREDHTSDWLRVVPISGLGLTMNGKTYRSVMCYRLGVPLFSVSKPCLACSRFLLGIFKGITPYRALELSGLSIITIWDLVKISNLNLYNYQSYITPPIQPSNDSNYPP